MCQFCTKHGDGKKWYLRAENYAEDLLSDLRRREFIADFFGHPERLAKDAERLNQIDKAPAFVRRAITARMKKTHFGQVVPLEEVQEILGFVNSIVRLPCICRHVTLGREVGHCYAVSMGPGGGTMLELAKALDGSFLGGPDTHGLQEVQAEEALHHFAEHEKQGLCHTVWTFVTPFIGGVCNCDRADCLAMQATVVHDLKMMFRAEHVAAVDPDRCTGCRECMEVCQFGALAYSGADEKVSVDLSACYGCGVCRSVCPNDAVELKPRAEVPAAAGLW